MRSFSIGFTVLFAVALIVAPFVVFDEKNVFDENNESSIFHYSAAFAGGSMGGSTSSSGGNLYDCDGTIPSHDDTTHRSMCDGDAVVSGVMGDGKGIMISGVIGDGMMCDRSGIMTVGLVVGGGSDMFDKNDGSIPRGSLSYAMGGSMGGSSSGGMTENGDTNCGAKHHRTEVGGDCVPCPNSSITGKAATRSSSTSRVKQHSQSTGAKPPVSIDSGSDRSGGRASPSTSTGFKTPASVTGN